MWHKRLDCLLPSIRKHHVKEIPIPSHQKTEDAPRADGQSRSEIIDGTIQLRHLTSSERPSAVPCIFWLGLWIARACAASLVWMARPSTHCNCSASKKVHVLATFILYLTIWPRFSANFDRFLMSSQADVAINPSYPCDLKSIIPQSSNVKNKCIHRTWMKQMPPLLPSWVIVWALWKTALGESVISQ